MSKTLGLALGAGGARGVAHVGFLKALEEEGIRPDYISGSSMGSVVGACYAKGMRADDMKEILQNLKATDIMDIGLLPLSKLGLMRWNKVRRLMSSHLEDCLFSDLKIPFCCVAVDVLSAKLVVFQEGSVVDAVLASSSMPSVFRPVEKDGMLLVDGGVLCRVPARQVKAMGADVVVAVDVLGRCEKIEKIPNVFSMIMRVYDIMDASRTAEEHRKLRHSIDLWLEPKMPGENQYTMKYNPSVYDAGYQVGKENADKIKALLAGEDEEK